MEEFCLTDQKEMLKSKIQILKVFSNLEGEFGVLPGNQFSELYKKYREIYFNYASDISKSLIDSIKNFNFEQAAHSLILLDPTNGFNFPQKRQIKQILNNAFNELVAETKDKSIQLFFNYELSPEEVEFIKNNLKRITEIRYIPIEFFNTEEVDNAINEIKSTISEKMNKYLDNVEALIKNNNFHEAHIKIESISYARNQLGTYCLPETTTRIDRTKENEKKMLDNVVESYEQLD